MSFHAITRNDLTAAEEENLVTVVRATERATVADTDGNAVVRYFPTSEQDAAMSRLLEAYVNDIRRAARTARVIDVEDAEMVATEKFLHLAREDRGRANERLAGFVSRAMVNAVMDADAEASAIRIPPDTLRRYFNLVRDEGSVEGAFEKCKAGAESFDPVTLLAVHRALNAESVEARFERHKTGMETSNADGDGDSGVTSAAYFTNNDLQSSTTPGPEEAVVQAHYVAWLFTLVPTEQAVILRLSYGFTDPTSEHLRAKGDYPIGSTLSDAQISPLVSRSRASVNRARNDALRVMHDASLAIALSA